MLDVQNKHGFWWINGHLVIPNVASICAQIFHWAHDLLGHFGVDKSYAALQNSYFWPKMKTSLEHHYVPTCPDCQQYKAAHVKPSGPLHPLLVPDQHGSSIVMDFVGLLPDDNGFNCILTMTDHLGSEILIIPTTTN